MNKNTFIKKLILLKMLKNNISGNIYGHKEKELKKIKNKIIKSQKYKNIKPGNTKRYTRKDKINKNQ